MSEPMDCPHNVDGYCQVSTDLAQMPVPIARDACAACILQTHPRTKNSVTCSKAIQYRSYVGMLPTEELLECVKPPARGVGTEMEFLIERTRSFLHYIGLGWLLPPRAQCGCSDMRSFMNQQGISGCLRKRHQITTEILQRWSNHLPAIRFVPLARLLIGFYLKLAMRRFQKKEIAHG